LIAWISPTAADALPAGDVMMPRSPLVPSVDDHVMWNETRDVTRYR